MGAADMVWAGVILAAVVIAVLMASYVARAGPGWAIYMWWRRRRQWSDLHRVWQSNRSTPGSADRRDMRRAARLRERARRRLRRQSRRWAR